MARFFRRPVRTPKAPVIAPGDYLGVLSEEFHLSKDAVLTAIRAVGIDTEHVREDQMDLLREVLSCKTHNLDRYKSKDPGYEDVLDEEVRSFNEIYVDTAPIIQMDWFLHFVVDMEPILKRRKKKLLILEKTMEELHGLKDNPEKDKEVRIRATIRPDLIRSLAKQGLVRIGDTGSEGIADDHLVNLFSRIGMNEDVLLITQDRGLSERIVKLAHEQQSVQRQPYPQTFWEKLMHKELRYPARHTMVVCKLTEGGILRRCYVCPDCGESYYDQVSDCDGVVPCSKCIMDHKVRGEQEMDALKKKQEAEALKAQREAYLKSRPTVEKVIQRRKRQAAFLTLAIGIVVIIILCIVL